MTIVVETAVACAIAWALRKARRVGDRADIEVDYALDSAMDRVHQVVVDRLGPGGDVERLELEAAFAHQRNPEQAEQTLAAGLTRHSIETVLTQAVNTDEVFAARLESAVAEYRDAASKASPEAFGAYGVTVGGNLQIKADQGAVAGAVIHVQGNLNLGNAPRPDLDGR
ncbi:hypothetical protein GCM10010441_72310 [Kitasatospora paracochleata]|uniref:Uncharacterized protein n=1 Tax=Kitasatospora paracochleata TaxID=58354 RepID=A0ABT1J948_9ACTN|nr:hypothetical protein [Kitasatospora paracochleata]MCP2313971.1 hypothetical protein [Kitasatospora paracochleata]